nr:DUF262 domain-containing protein [Komagataeibacter sp. FNDCF1]
MFDRTKDSIDGRLNLPVYQRPYCWGEKQVRQLEDDLRQYFRPDQSDNGIAFYLGSIVLHQHEDEHGQLILDIIDGQQRLTTMAILCAVLELQGQKCPVPELEYRAPASHEQIRRNFVLLEGLLHDGLAVKLDRINVSVIITQDEDEAWRFFQTLNAGGVRLSGIDIIKAHHLRAITPPLKPDHYARLWESTGDVLTPVVNRLIRGRFWTSLHYRTFDRADPRNDIIAEFAERTQRGTQDNAYRPSVVEHLPTGGVSHTVAHQGYALRQPLHDGVNTIHYLLYFSRLYQSLFPEKRPDGDLVHALHEKIVRQSAQSNYLRELYETAILLYASRFGMENLPEACLWLFRLIFSLRVTKSRVTEPGVRNFCREQAILDHIAYSFNHVELMQYLTAYKYSVDHDGLEGGRTKKYFVESVYQLFGSTSPEKVDEIIRTYDNFLMAQFRCHVSLPSYRVS